jgi:hypothetical protein
MRPKVLIGRDAAARVCAALHEGHDLSTAVERLPSTASERWRVIRAADKLAALMGIADAATFIARLRTDGLDDHFEEIRKASARPDRDDLQALEEAQKEASGLSLTEYAALRAKRKHSLLAARDQRNGIELTTVHRAKGRQWPRVVLVRCDEGVLPHTNAMLATPQEQQAGEGLEAERRIAYVAFTRAQQELSILHTTARQSRFLSEAGLVGEPAELSTDPSSSRTGFWREPSARRPAHSRPATGVDEHLERAREVGLIYALSVLSDRSAALELAAVALERELIGAATQSEKLSVRQLLKAIPGLTTNQRGEVRKMVPFLSLQERVAGIAESKRRGLVVALRTAEKWRR